MEKIYRDPRNPGSLGGVERFRKAAGVTRKQAVEFLEKQDEYTVNKERRLNFHRNPVIVTNLQHQYQMDLADLSKYKNQNGGVAFLLVAIDCFSRLASVHPVKNKTGKEIVAALTKVFNDLGVPDKIQTDKGTEFFNTHVKQFLKEKEVTLFSSENDDVKCAMAERLIRTLKARIWHLFRLRVSTKYIDKLQDIVYAYNHSEHAAHGMKPADVSQSNSLDAFNRLYGELIGKKRTPKFKAGDAVQIAKNKGKFEKGYEYRFQEQLFFVSKVIPHQVPLYILEDDRGKKLKGKFYEQEMSRVGDSKNKRTVIDRVIKAKGNKVLVRWLGYDKSHDSWIKKSDLKDK